MTKKKILSFLTSAVMTAGCLGSGMFGIINNLTANALSYSAQMQYDDYLYYKAVDSDDDYVYDSVMISKCDTSAVEVQIPSVIDGLPVTDIDGNAFYNCENLECLTIDADITDLEYIPYQLDSLTEINISEDNSQFSSTDGVLFSKDKTCLIKYPESKGDSEYVVPDTVTEISEFAFENCKNLTAVTVSDNVKSIGTGAFFCSEMLESVIIGKSVKSTEKVAFYECSSLSSIAISDNVSVIGEQAFYNCSSLRSITIPESVSATGERLFSSCTALESVNIKGNIERIETGMFYGCESLTDVIIPDSVTSIGSSAFYECKALTDISIGSNVESIENAAFAYCTSLAGITIPDSVTSIGNSAFMECINLKQIEIPESVTSIDSYAFERCTNLADITIPKSLKEIGYAVFSKTLWLENRQAENPLVTVNGILIDGKTCSGEVIIPDNVIAVNKDAFYNCDEITSVEVPKSVTEIGYDAFYSCDNLESITIENPTCEIYDSETTISNAYIYGYTNSAAWFDGVIYGYENSTAQAYADKYDIAFGYLGTDPLVTVPAVTTTPEPVYTWAPAMTESETTPTYLYSDLKYYIAGENAVICGYEPSETTQTTVSVPEEIDGKTVKGIDSNVFNGCDTIKEIILPNSITSVGKRAFYNCTALEKINIPDGVAIIYDETFEGCENLKSISIGSLMSTLENIPYSQKSIEEINVSENNHYFSSENGVLYNKDKTEVIVVPDSTLTEFIIPDSVTNIRSGAFDDCNMLERITLGAGITTLENIPYTLSCVEQINVSEDNLYYSAENGILYDKTKTVLIKCPKSDITEMVIPETVVAVSGSAFTGCTALSTVKLGENVTSIGNNAFYGCNQLSEIVIPSAVTFMGERSVGYSSEGNLIDGFKIYGTDGTTAEEYALENGITFVDVNKDVMLSHTELVLKVGEQELLTVSNYASGVTWLSENTDVVTVKDGYVTATGEGTATVYAIAGDYTLTCNITVSDTEAVTTSTTVTTEKNTTTQTTATSVSDTEKKTSVSATTTKSTATSGSSTSVTTNKTTSSVNSSTSATTTSVIKETTVSTTSSKVTSTEKVTTLLTTTSAVTTETTEPENVFVTVENNGTVVIISCNESVVNVTVPNKLNGLVVSRVNDFAFYGCKNLESITFENPAIQIADSETAINEKAVIYGYWDSTAHDYAIKFNRKFESLNGEPQIPSGDANGDTITNVRDCAFIASALAKGEGSTLSESADFNKDGKVNVRDAAALAKGEL